MDDNFSVGIFASREWQSGGQPLLIDIAAKDAEIAQFLDQQATIRELRENLGELANLAHTVLDGHVWAQRCPYRDCRWCKLRACLELHAEWLDPKEPK